MEENSSDVEQMNTFMNDLLMVSKIEADEIDFRPECTSFEQLIQELAAEHYRLWKNGIQLRIQSKALLRQISIDQKMLRHAIQNMVESTFQYSTLIS